MSAVRNLLLRWLPESTQGRYQAGMLTLGFLFLLMTVPYIARSDAAAGIRAVVLAMYVVIGARWYHWRRGGRPTNLDLVNEISAIGLTAVLVNDPFTASTIVWAAACFVPLFVSLKRLAVALAGYAIAFLLGLAIAAGSIGVLTDPQVIMQPPTFVLTGGIVYFFIQVLNRQEQLLEENASILRQAHAGEHRFRSLVEALPGVILTSTPQGGIRYASPQLEPLFGFNMDDVHGDWVTLVTRVIHPDDQKALFAVMMPAAATGAPFSHECRAITPAGETLWIQLQSVLVDDGSPDAPVWQTLIFDVTERHSLTEQLTHQAFHDALTGLPNRLLFNDRVGHALERSQREITTTAVCFIDLDNFKIVNDSLGHKYGDLLVIEVGERLRSCLRQGDTVARLGGDEFALLLEGLRDRDEAICVVDRALARLAQPFTIEGQPVFSTASIGIAFSSGQDIERTELIRFADVAMYEAKRRGKGRYEIFEPHMEDYARQRMDLEVDLRHALERHEFRVAYQPIVNLDTGAIHEVEALIRWQHPTRGLLGPAEFLPTAEETGLIIPIGRWILTAACRQVSTWRETVPGCDALMLSVNLSPRQLQGADLAGDIANALSISGLEPHRLQLEVAESAMLEDIEQATQAINELTALGVRIAIDDFGTGNSSLGHLRRLPVHMLKIDRSYVMELGKSEQGTTMLRAMVTLGKTLGMDITAEGIETIEQTALRAFGCDYGQGYYFAKPLFDTEMAALLAGRERFSILESHRLEVVTAMNEPPKRAAV